MPVLPDVITAVAANANGGEDFYGEIIRENLNNRILVFNDQVDENVMENYILRIMKWNKEDRNIPVENRYPIRIYIDCPGGETITGLNLVDVIVQSKTPVIGVAFSMAASMGYHIFIACHERVAFKDTVLLQHDGELVIQNSSSKAKDTMQFFNSMDQRLKEHVLSHTKMTEEFYEKIYDQEYWIFADDAQSLGIVDKIIGKDVDIDYIY